MSSRSMLRPLKKAVKPLLIHTYSRYCRSHYTRRGLAIVCPPIPAENLGDQAMVLGALAELSRRGARDPVLITTGPRFGLDSEIPEGVALADRHQFFGSDQSFSEECALLRDCAKSRDMLVFGADVLDGHYGRQRYERTFAAIETAVTVGTRVRVIGFSISGAPDQDAVRFFRQYSDRVQLYPRDPVTLRRLREAGASNLTLAADVAFLMPPADERLIPEESRRFIDDHKGRLVGICLHAHFFDTNLDVLPRYMVETFIHLAREEASAFLFVPHHPADLKYFELMAALVPLEFQERFRFLDALPTAPTAKRLFAECRHVVTSRMHVAIAALSMQIPVTCFPYLGKFEGLFEHFRLETGLLDVDQFREPADLAGGLRARMADEAAFREKIVARLPAVVALARSNFDFD